MKVSGKLSLPFLIVLVGCVLIARAMALSTVAFEAESGTKGGGDVAYVSDATASGGSALVFTAPSGNVDYGNDKWLFVGDSITVISVNNTLTTLVKNTSPSRNPTIINQAIGGTTAETWADSSSAMGSISGVLASSDAKFVPIALGTNDYQPVFKANYEKLIQAVIAAGRVPVLPYMPWTNGESPGKEALINADIESLLTKYPQAM